ncbi:MAG: hypothetical protein OCC45_11560 [Desulfotalea sp.]
MIIKCSSCDKKFKASDKLVKGLQALPAGEKMRLKCPTCSSLFGISYGDLLSGDEPAVINGVAPPSAPDLSWLDQGAAEDGEDVIEELPTVLLLIRDESMFATISDAFKSLGYRVETAANSDEAIEKMEFFLYAAVVMHSAFERGGVENSKFHRFISMMDMTKRRKMLYFLVGAQFSTLYDLEALAYSVNQVVNDKDVKHFSVLARKLVREYEVLFGPLIRELEAAGR